MPNKNTTTPKQDMKNKTEQPNERRIEPAAGTTAASKRLIRSTVATSNHDITTNILQPLSGSRGGREYGPRGGSIGQLWHSPHATSSANPSRVRARQCHAQVHSGNGAPVAALSKEQKRRGVQGEGGGVEGAAEAIVAGQGGAGRRQDKSPCARAKLLGFRNL